MQTQYTYTIKLTPREVTTILKEHLQNACGITVTSVDLNTSKRLLPSGDLFEFSGADIKGLVGQSKIINYRDRLIGLGRQTDAVEVDTTNGNR